MASTSRLPGFYELSLAERRQRILDQVRLPSGLHATLVGALDSGGLTPESADKIVENVLGVYSLPFGVALNFQVNGRDVIVPMVVEEPSVIAAASNAARMIRAAGGFTAVTEEALMTTQVLLSDVRDVDHAVTALEANAERLIALGNDAVPNLVRRGGGVRGMHVRALPDAMLAIHFHVDCKDAMGANLVNLVAEAIGPVAAELAQGKLGLRILTNLSDRRRVRVTARIHEKDLAVSSFDAESNARVVDAIVQASRFAEVDPYRAATHNKGIMNGIDSVIIATGNDARAVEAGAHAYAARNGTYAPLATWRKVDGMLVGEMTLPLALGTVGGTLRVHPVAKLAVALTEVTSADELAQVAACVGLASNLAAIRALATEGISRGHLSLHARSVATAAGALGAEVEQVARLLAQDLQQHGGHVTVDNAQRLLADLRRGGPAE
jgi:hydroxymethylglutaryl-CoA reductase